MRRTLNALIERFGEDYGRKQWAWYMQKYNVSPWDECDAMAEAVERKLAKAERTAKRDMRKEGIVVWV